MVLLTSLCLATPLQGQADEAAFTEAVAAARQMVVDGQYQKYVVMPGSYIRDHFFGKYPETAELVADFQALHDLHLPLHRDLPWDDWRLITTECDVAHGGRALSRRMLFTPDGRLVASMAQEQLIPRVGGGG